MNRGFALVMGLVKFRRAVRKLPALESPAWLEVVKALQELDSSICRLMKQEGYEDRKGRKGRVIDDWNAFALECCASAHDECKRMQHKG